MEFKETKSTASSKQKIGRIYRPTPNGSMPFKLGAVNGVIVGGPYAAKPDSMRGVKMAREISMPCDIDIPTDDFSTPDVSALLYGMDMAVDILSREGRIYVGCMGGIGRTGLFMAAMAKLMGEEDPVGYVRKHYIPHAVETKRQQEFISKLDVDGLRRVLLEQHAPKKKSFFELLIRWFMSLFGR